MADVRIRVKDEFMNELRATLGLSTNTEVVQDALTLLKWAADERKKDRMIVSTDSRGTNLVRLALRSLDSVQPRPAATAN